MGAGDDDDGDGVYDYYDGDNDDAMIHFRVSKTTDGEINFLCKRKIL